MKALDIFGILKGKTGSRLSDDTQGKHKVDDARTRYFTAPHVANSFCFEKIKHPSSLIIDRRSQLLLLLFCGMMAVGFITAQYIYIWVQNFDEDIQTNKVILCCPVQYLYLNFALIICLQCHTHAFLLADSRWRCISEY